ncbi:MAG: conjugative transposon protein TraM [Bacteroidetes bacterium]|nr:conjugative transposon protein TraM [Bacteroidota bacterium]
MENKTITPALSRQRRFLLMLPVLVLPFTILLFRVLGGGTGNPGTLPVDGVSGINNKLPDAHFKNVKEKDKLAMYEQAGKDSARFRDALKNDPYAAFEPRIKDSSQNSSGELQAIFQRAASKYNQFSLSGLQATVNGQNVDSNEQKVFERIAQLKTVLYNNKQNRSSPGSINSTTIPALEQQNNLGPQKRIATKDPELEQLDQMLEKVMLIQHPEKMKDSLEQITRKNKPVPANVNKAAKAAIITSMTTPSSSSKETNQFYGLDDNVAVKASQNTIEAFIPETQTFTTGATIKLRLLTDIEIGTLHIPQDEFVYGIASLSNDRLKIAISSVGYKNNLIPVSLSVYDADGQEGVYVPGSINRDAGKQSADEALSTLGITTFDPSIGAQAASAGIQAAKSLIGKKIKLVRITIKEGYHVYLKDNNQK